MDKVAVKPSPEDVVLFQIILAQITALQESLDKAISAKDSLIAMFEGKYQAKLDASSGTLFREVKDG